MMNRQAWVLLCVFPLLIEASPAGAQEGGMTIQNEYAAYAVGANGANLHFVERQTGTDYCAQAQKAPFARVVKEGKEFGATSAAYANGVLTAQFGASGVSASIKVTIEKHYFVFEVASISDEGVQQFIFVDIPLTLKGEPQEPFAGCALALNLKTNVPEIPRASSRLRAICYPRFGFVGAKVALIGCPQGELRQVMQEVVSAAPDLPKSSIGGPWALDAPTNYGSYLFNFGDLSEEKVDDWIRFARRLGVTQIDFHGGNSFRFGDCEPNPKTYPRGRASLKAVIDKLHAAGIMAGLHTYSQFIDKRCPWVTPVPDARLGTDAVFTLAEALTPQATTVRVEESTKDMSPIAGGHVRNSVTLWIDDELITFKGIAKEPPYAFTECKRGALGTRPASHAKGAKVKHMRECFGLFLPDGDSTLYTEVAAKTAEMFNECGFDMIYLDALDGSDAVAGREYAWHYAAKFTFELFKRLKKPALMEMSTFGHHLWFVRSRMGAWDHPNRSHKKFVDIHCAANEVCKRWFLPANLGWWAFKTWGGPQNEPTLPDDIEYLCGKALANDNSLSIMGIDPYNVHKIPALPRLAAIMRRYEDLRNANYFSEAAKEKLRVPGDEYTLLQSPEGEWHFRQVQYDKHKVEGLNGWSNIWKVVNKFGRQPLQVRIEALLSAGPYDSPGNVTLADFSNPNDFPDRASQPGVLAKLEPSSAQVKVGTVSGCYTATNNTNTRQRTWSRCRKTFTPALNLANHQAMGLWVYGDGKGEVLNLQITDPVQISWGAIGDHYIIVDFTGWRYFELIEPEGKRFADYSWPYPGGYAIYRCCIHYPAVETLSLYYNNIPPKETVTCYLSPIRALPTFKAKIRNPAIKIGDKTIRFPVEIESGSYLEFKSPTDCRVYGPKGEVQADVKPEGEVPVLESGENEVQFMCECQPGVNPRAYVSIISVGDALRGRNAQEKIRWTFLREEQDDPRTVRALDGIQNVWEVACRPSPEPASLELEILAVKVGEPGAGYESQGAVSLETFDSLDGFADGPQNQYLKYVVSGDIKGVATSPGVTHRLEIATDAAKMGKSSVRYTATSEKPGGWSARGKRFLPPLDLSSCTHVGFWLHGDGQGEILYLQLRDVAGAHFDMKTKVDFTDWKYVEFALVNAPLDLSKVEYLILYYNDLPAGKTITCCVDDVRAFKDVRALERPALAIGKNKVTFAAKMGPGERLEYLGPKRCRLFGADGAFKADVHVEGEAISFKPGLNKITFSLEGGRPSGFEAQVQVTKVYQLR